MGAGNTCFHDLLIFFLFFPSFHINKTVCSPKCFHHVPLISKNFCTVPFIPQNICDRFPYLSAWFTFQLTVKTNPFDPPLSSSWNPLMLYFYHQFISFYLLNGLKLVRKPNGGDKVSFCEDEFSLVTQFSEGRVLFR